MPEELSYVLVTPNSVRKSRTGGILSRLLARTGLELVSARMFAPGRALTEEYAASLRTRCERLGDYALASLPSGTERRRALLLVLKGENAVVKVAQAVGCLSETPAHGATLSDTYGDYVTDADGHLVYFEPGVIAPPDAASAMAELQLFARYSDTDGGVLTDPEADGIETSLVLIKPDNLRFPNTRPGGVIDTFARTGLALVAVKVHRMSVAQASQFYGPVLDVLKDKLRERCGSVAREAIERDLGCPLNNEVERQLGDLIGPVYGQYHWESIIEFMAGRRPGATPENEREEPGSEKMIALIYQGVDAVAKIRDVLGPTDPSKAPHGTIRKEFGQTIMVNAGHASDSVDNARREMGIVRIEENNLRPTIESFYGSL